MTVTEAARELVCSPSAVHKAIGRGTLAARSVPGYRGRPQYVIEPAEVARYKAEHRTLRRLDREQGL